MKSRTDELEEVILELGQVLDHPQTFGLGQSVPPLLADLLETTRRILVQILNDPAYGGDLAADLPLDADEPFR